MNKALDAFMQYEFFCDAAEPQHISPSPEPVQFHHWLQFHGSMRASYETAPGQGMVSRPNAFDYMSMKQEVMINLMIEY